MTDEHPLSPQRDRRRITLERLLAIQHIELKPALDTAATIVAEALDADKVDAFLYDAGSESLVAVGTSDTPMGRRQHAIGLNRLPLANGGRAVEVFRTGHPHHDGHVEDDPAELEGIKRGLGVRSAIIRPVEITGERRGVVAAVSGRPETFSGDDLSFFEAVGGWLALVLHRAELVGRYADGAEERGRREAILALLNLLTPRQREVAALVAGGMTNAQIADRLALTQGTVDNHVEHILRRLSVRSRTEVASLVAEAGLRPSSPDGT
jgi:DNA-binding CsgD family transcriptional regulator